MNTDIYLYRTLEPSDIGAGLLLCRSAGWNQTAKDWELFLQLNPAGCFVATDQTGKIVGTVTTVRYQDHFGWIGMVLVDPNYQKRGIGLELVKKGLEYLGTSTTSKLDATPAGREVYLKLGFREEYSLSRQECARVTVPFSSSSATAMERQDIGELLDIDHRVFGADRRQILQSLFDRAPEHAFVVRINEEIKGYCFGRQGHRFTQIGPLVADSRETAIAVVSAALRKPLDQPVVIDVPGKAAEWKSWLADLGFTEQRQLTRMFLGRNAYPGLPENQFGILGPEFG